MKSGRTPGAVDQRCDRCGIELDKHDGGEFRKYLALRLFRCRGCNAVLCANQVKFSNKQHRKTTGKIGIHTRYALGDELRTAGYFTIKESPEGTRHSMMKQCGVVDVLPTRDDSEQSEFDKFGERWEKLQAERIE